MPKIEKEPGDQYVNLGESLKVKFSIIGKGPFTFKLKKDGELLPDSECKIKINELDGTVILTLPSN